MGRREPGAEASLWLAGLTALLPAAHRQALAPAVEWSARLPLGLVERVALELDLDGPARPASLHVQVAHARAGDATLLAAHDDGPGWSWPALARVVAAGAPGAERGFAIEPDVAGVIRPAALYAAVSSDDDVALVLRESRVEPATSALVQRIAADLVPSHAGVMPGRAGTPVRLVLPPGSITDQAWGVLADAPGAPAAALRRARAIAEDQPPNHVWLNVDLAAGRMGPRLGVEVKRPTDGLAPSGSLDPLRAWEGRRLLAPSGGPAGADEVRAVALGQEGQLERRVLNHVKLTVAEGAPTTAKAYLFAHLEPAVLAPAEGGAA